jgi:predicted nucleotidyltransferase
MATEDFRSQAREMLARLAAEAPGAVDRESLLDNYADDLTRLYGQHAHALLHEVIEDARTRLDARLSPDPVRQTIATVQTAAQDIWKTLFGP